jgi:Zn ribbon nucleic-acid-binding protein
MGKKKTHEEFIEEVYKQVGYTYDVLGKYEKSIEKITFIHHECNNTFSMKPRNFLQGNRCPNCFKRNKKKTHEEFVREVYDLIGNEYTVIGKYTYTKIKLKIRHNYCTHEWMVTPHNFLRGTRCPKCFGKNKSTTDEFKKKVFEMYGDEYEVLSEYVNNSTHISMKHTICNHTYKVLPSNFLRERRCPQCTESKGERKVREYLNKNLIVFKQQFEFEGLIGVGGNNLRFDFAIFNEFDKLICLIEYDGEFHYKKFYEDQSFEVIQIHDNRKNKYCEERKIPLLRIPFWEINNIERILDEFLIINNLKEDSK